MHIAKLDLKHGTIFFDSESIEVDENGVLLASIAKLCSPPAQINHRKTRYRLLRKVSVFGKSADAVMDIEQAEGISVTFPFYFIEFFESSILESKIIKTCEKFWNFKFISNHPSTAFLDPCEWGSAVFFYDAKQGDLSLEIKVKRDQMNFIQTQDFQDMS